MAYNAYGGPTNRQRPNPMVFGTPMQPRPADPAGAAVTPQTGAGAASPMSAVPSMAGGGAIPDGSPNTDVVDYTGAMKVVRDALNFGRQQHGLSIPQQSSSVQQSGPKQSDQSDSAGIPDDSDSDGDTEGEDGGEASYEEGGAIENPAGDPNPYDNGDEQDAAPAGDDNSGAGPVAGAIPDDSGAGPVVAGASAPPADASVAQQFNDADSGGPQAQANPQLAISYLEGKGAAPPEQLEDYRKQVDPTGGQSTAEQNLMAVATAKNSGGDQAAFPLIQTQRRIYDSYLARARAALEGVQGRPPDLHEATTAASRAYDNLLDGVSTTFKAEGNGVLAHVKMPGVSEAQTYKLSTDQFGSLLDSGKGGMYDALLEHGGAPAVLPQAAQAQASITPPAPATPGQPNGMARYVHNFQQPGDKPAASGVGPNSEADRSVDLGHDVTQLNSPKYGRLYGHSTSPERIFTPEERKAMTPTKAEQDQADRLELIKAKGAAGGDKMALEKLRGENRMAVEGEKNKRAQSGQAERADYHSKLIDARLKEATARTQNANAHDRRATLNTIVQAAGGYDRLSPDQKKMVDQALTGGGQQAPQQQQTAPQRQQAAPPPVEQREAGKTTVTTAKGSFVWNGRGWDKAPQ